MVSEMLVDWLKHAFITKFNHIRPSVYERYTDVLCRDLASGSAVGRKGARKVCNLSAYYPGPSHDVAISAIAHLRRPIAFGRPPSRVRIDASSRARHLDRIAVHKLADIHAYRRILAVDME